MSPWQQVDYILHECLFAVGQQVGTHSRITYDAVVWLRARYRDRFLHAITVHGNSWERDRKRVTAVSSYLGQRALHHAGRSGLIDVPAVARAADDVESGCRMNAIREGLVPEVGGLYRAGGFGVLREHGAESSRTHGRGEYHER